MLTARRTHPGAWSNDNCVRSRLFAKQTGYTTVITSGQVAIEDGDFSALMKPHPFAEMPGIGHAPSRRTLKFLVLMRQDLGRRLASNLEGQSELSSLTSPRMRVLNKEHV